MALVGKSNEEKIWNYLKDSGLNDYGAAGLMGNLYAESGLRPENLQNTYEKSLGLTDAEYTAAVDNGSYTNFVRDSAGYGLAQWTFWSRKQALLEYVQRRKKSIGDLETQLGFLIKELAGYTGILNALKTAKTVKEASDCILVNYERPADQSDAVKAKRAAYGQKYYAKYAASGKAESGTAGMTEAQLRQKVVDIAVSYLGCKESDGSHKKIIDLYNSHKPLARGYTVKYTDAWCSTFASAVAIKAGLTDIIPTECGCEKHIELFKQMGSWVENDAYVPKPGDYIFYDWQDTGAGDCTGYADHVGIVVSCTDSSIKVIEGNMDDAVGYRNLVVNGRYIRGFGTPKYSSKATVASTVTSSAPAAEELPGVDDVVEFTGSKHYLSSQSTYGVTCKPGKARVTRVSKGSKHPVHLIAVSGSGSTVYGWVDTTDINTDSEPEYETYTVVKGDTLWTIAQRKLGNGSKYKDIMTINGLTSTVIHVGQVLKMPE